jgi:hypothetical protein
MLPNRVGSTDARTWRLADGPRRRCDSHSRVAVVSAGLRWHGLCGNVKSITEQIQHTLNIAKVTAQAKGQPALRRVAPAAVPHHSTPYVVSLRWTHRMMTMTSRRWGGSARGSADQPLAHCAESAAAHISGVRKASRAGSQTACLIKAGTLLNIWLYFHHGTHA